MTKKCRLLTSIRVLIPMAVIIIQFQKLLVQENLEIQTYQLIYVKQRMIRCNFVDRDFPVETRIILYMHGSNNNDFDM